MNIDLPQYYPSSFITIMLIVIVGLFVSTYVRGNDTLHNLFRQLVYRHASAFSIDSDLYTSNHRKFILNILLPCVAFLIVYQSSRLYLPSAFALIKENLIILLIAIVLLLLIRHFVYKFLGAITDNVSITNQFLELNFAAGQIYTIISIPLLIVFFYAPPIIKLVSFFILMFSLSVLFIILIYRGLLIFVLNKYPIFYFILYLCAVEIMPVAILAKWLLF
ncbi:MAG: DUF4271 domain-containing protein [Bacteroidales bacterium]